MLRFLSSLFSGSEEQAGGLDETLLDKATERVLMGTDPRLRALGDCRKKLRGPVEQAARHVIGLVDALPAPVDISPRVFGEDPRLRAFFVSPEHVGEVFGGINAVRDYLADCAAPPEHLFGLLSMVREERNVFGIELAENELRRDVMQVAVNFSNHRYLAPNAAEDAARWDLKKRAFDFLVGKALERLMEERGKRRELDHQQHLLRKKLDAMRAGHWGLGAALDNGERAGPATAAELEAEIEAIEEELGSFSGDNLSLEESLACIAETLGQPAEWLAVRELRLRLDYRGILVDETASTPSNEIALTELYSNGGPRRTVLFGRIAHADIPAPPDFWQAAKRYL